MNIKPMNAIKQFESLAAILKRSAWPSMCSFNLIFSVSMNLLAPSLDTNVLRSEYVVIFDKSLDWIFFFFPTNLFQMSKAKLEDLFLLVILSEGEPAKIQTC